MMEATSASELDTPLWIPYLVIPVAFGLLALEFITLAVARIGLIRGREATTTAVHI
jgi:TRAP-type mannitol/chloroaromatic compound transport system permease small subunit